MILLKRLSDIGVRPDDDFFESRLKRAVNLLSVNAMLCILISACYGFFAQHRADSLYILWSFPFYFLAIYINKTNRVLLAVTCLFITSSLLLTIYSILQGPETFTQIHYVNNIYGISLLYNRDKAKNYFFFNMSFTILSIVFVLLSFYYDWFLEYRIFIPDPALERRINFIILAFCSLLFSSVIVKSYIYQRKALQASLDEQKTLLAELNHRVKNNLAIIVSLLNLKRESSENTETREALNECRNRVMSMALVHQKMYQSESKNDIRIQPYIKELVNEIKNSLQIKKEIDIHTNIEDVKLNIATAIPLGLILNELITNSFKHAFHDNTKPEIKIQLQPTHQAGGIKLIVKDNGKGFGIQEEKIPDGLGLILIKSLCEQIDGTHAFTQNNGLEFSLVFTVA